MANNENVLDKFKVNQSEKKIDTSKKIRIGLIGCGWIAQEHIRLLIQMPDVELAAAADLVPGKAEKLFDEYAPGFDKSGVRFYNSHKELIDAEKDNLDAVDICTYNRTHAECTIYALENGLNVLQEKPLCVTMDEAVAIRKAEKASGKILSIGFQPRFNPNMIMLKKICQSGVLGKIYYIQTGGGRRKGIPTPYGTSFIADETGGIGAMGDIGCYSLDMVLNAIGYPKPLTVSGYASSYFGRDPQYYIDEDKPAEYADKFDVEDFAAGFIRLEGGIILDFRIAWAMNLDTSGDTIIMGTKGSIRIPSTECWNGDIGGPLTLYQTVAGELVQTSFPKHDPVEGGEFALKLRYFVDAVKEGGVAPVSTEQIIINQAIIDGIIRSNKLGREIPIEIPEI